jgi:hypothetical protein
MSPEPVIRFANTSRPHDGETPVEFSSARSTCPFRKNVTSSA